MSLEGLELISGFLEKISDSKEEIELSFPELRYLIINGANLDVVTHSFGKHGYINRFLFLGERFVIMTPYTYRDYKNWFGKN